MSEPEIRDFSPTDISSPRTIDFADLEAFPTACEFLSQLFTQLANHMVVRLKHISHSWNTFAYRRFFIISACPPMGTIHMRTLR